LRDPVLVIALHESANAWAYAYFEDGKRMASAFRPRELFEDVGIPGRIREDWDGDAWAEAHTIADKYELNEPFLSYQQVAGNPSPSTTFLTFRRKA
jgi:hypothetical protein